MAAEGQLSPAKPDDETTNAPVNKATTCIDVGAQFKRWTDLKNDLHCGNDTLAKLLLDIWFQFKEEDADTNNMFRKKIPENVKAEAPTVQSERRNSSTQKSGSSSLQNSRDGFDTSTCSSNEELSLANRIEKNKTYGEQCNGNDSSSRRRKQPKSRVSRYLEEEGEMATTLEDYEAWRGKWDEEAEEKDGDLEDDGTEYVDDADNSNICEEDNKEEEEEEEEDFDPENDFLSEAELEKILKGSESESECKRKRKRDSDSDWMPTADDNKTRRRRSRRISKQSVRSGTGRGRRMSRRKVSTSGESSEEEKVVEEKPKTPRGRPRKVKKEPEEDERTESQHLSKPKLIKKSGVFTCIVCSEKFTKKEEGKEHLETHYTIDCNFCTQRFFSQQTLDVHQSKKHPTNHKCSQCLFIGRTRVDLKRHMRKEHQEADTIPGTTLCHICGEQFRFVVNVQKHLMEVHGIMETNMKTYMCDQCGNEYFLKHSLRKHMLTHKDKNIICEFEGCCSKFSSDAQYKRHYNTVHLKIKRHACPYEDCDMKFAFRKTLATHVNMVHLKLRLFPCSWPGCERSFYAKKHLTVHLRIHNDEKPFKCQQCDYRCRQRAALNWHLKKHGIVPDHPESLENEKRNKKDGFPVNFKRGRKRTRFRKAKSLDYTDDQIASINRRYNDMISDVDLQMYHVKNLPESSVAQEGEDSPEGSDTVHVRADGRESVTKRDGHGLEDLKYLERREPPPQISSPPLPSSLHSLPTPHPPSQRPTDPLHHQRPTDPPHPQRPTDPPHPQRPTDPPPQRLTDHAQGFARRDLQSPAQETYPVDLLKREVDYPPIDYDPQKQVRMNDFHPVRETDFRENNYQSVRESEFQHARENSMSSARDEGFHSIRESFTPGREGSYQHVRESDYHQVRTPTSEYQGYTMKENLDTDRGFPRFLSKDVFTSSSHRESNFTPRLPIKDTYMSGHPVTEIDYSRFPPKNELSALRTLPPGFQSQMDVPQEYDPRSPVHPLMGGNSVGYSQDLQMYSREYK